MSSRFKEDAYVVCPFYTKEASLEIRCEGLCGEDTHTTTSFTRIRDKLAWKEARCCGNYRLCLLFCALNSKYEP